MPKRSRRGKGRSRKWSRANIMNIIAGGIVAFSMVLGSVFVFGGLSSNTANTTVSATATVVSTPTTAPVVNPGPTLTPTP